MRIEAAHPKIVWAKAVEHIRNNGRLVTTNNMMTIEVRNLELVINRPEERMWVAFEENEFGGFGWSMPYLENYYKQFCGDIVAEGFDYTYGERIKPCLQTIYREISSDDFDIHSRRLVIPVFQRTDLLKKHMPCLIAIDFLIRHGEVHCTAFFRSHDIARAWPSNTFGLYKLTEAVAEKLDGFHVGQIITYSVSAHVYTEAGY